MQETTELQEQEKSVSERDLLIGLTKAVMAMQQQQKIIVELLQEMLPNKEEESSDEPSLRELIMLQIEMLENIDKKLEK